MKKNSPNNLYTIIKKHCLLIVVFLVVFAVQKSFSQEIIASQYFNEEYIPVAESLDTIPVASKFIGATSTIDNWPYLGVVWEGIISTTDEKTSTDPFSLKLHNHTSQELLADDEKGILVNFNEIDISTFDNVSFSIGYASNGEQKIHDDLVLKFEYKLDDVWVKVDSVLLVDGTNNTDIEFGQTVPNITQPNNPYVTPPGSIPNDATFFRASVASRNYQGSDNDNAYYIDDVELLGITAEVLVSGNDAPIANGQTTTSPTNNTDFENVVINEAIKVFEYKIENVGSQELNLTGDPLISITGDTADFTVTVSPVTPILPDEASFFTIVFSPKSLGLKSIMISIANDDVDQNPYTFVVEGTGVDGDHVYCDPTIPPIPNDSSSYYINNVNVGAIDNTSTYVDPERYSYFSEFTTNLNIGESYFTRIFNETLENSDSGIGVWIDFNDDGDFEDVGEEVYTNLYTSGTGETNIERTFSILIPDNANLGVTRMRISVQEGEIPTPCGPFNQTGEVEDYDVNIVDLASQVPEAIVFGNGVPIIDGDNNPTLGDNTDFGLTEILTNPHTNTFAIANIGGLDLTLDDPSPYVVITGDTADFTLSLIPSSPISPISATTFEITFNPQTEGIKSAIISIANNDTTKNPYTFSIQGEGFIPVPEIEVLGNGILITNGDTTPRDSDGTDYGNIEEGIGIVSRTFSITNVGDLDLLLYNNPIVEVSGNISDFRLTVAPATTISPNDGTTFTIEFHPQLEGQKTATVSISNNDDDENPFTFDVTGYGIPFDYCGISAPLEIPASTSYYVSNVTTDIINNTTTYDEGRYSYYPATTPDYTIGSNNDMSITFQTEVNERIGASVWIDFNKDGDFFDPGEEIFTDLVEGSTVTSIERSFNFAIPTDVTIGITMMRVAVYKGDFPLPCGPYLQPGEIEDYLVNFIGEAVEAPKMNVYGNGISIANGDNTPNVDDDTYFGSVEVFAQTTSHTFTIKNEGVLDLSLDGSPLVTLTGDTADFTLETFPSTPITPSGTTTFSISFAPTENGEKSVSVEILNNDPIRSPYIFRIQGNGKLLNDNDGDLVLDENDADDDNDGILDVEENSDCNNAVAFTTALFVEDFGTQSLDVGTPSVFSPYLGSYEYLPLTTGTVPPDSGTSLTANKYSVFNNIQETASWADTDYQTLGDHTSGGTVASEGRMLLINTNQDLNSEYYRRDILANINVDIPLDVTISVLNLDLDIADNSGRILPNMEVIIEQSGTSYSVIMTGDIQRHASGDVAAWKTFSGSYTPTTSDPITIVIVDRASAGNGNEFALDDISVSQTQIICDVDGDGIPNKFDLDSDNDGIYDVVEVGGLDANNNGWADDDNDNTDNTASGGIPTSAGEGLVPTITDGEHADYVDLDSDNDGCSDANEAYGSPNADGGDDGRYGEGDPSILTNGTVSEALYSTPKDGDGNTIPDFIQLSKSIVGITRNPFDALVLEGTNVVFSIEMDLAGEGTNVAYQWQEDKGSGDGFVDLLDEGQYSGVQTLLLRIENVTLEMSGYKYRVLVTSESYVCDDDVISAEVLLSIAQSNLITVKTVNNLNPSEGEAIFYAITVTNNGPNDATNVSIVDVLPVEVTYVSDNVNGDYNPVDGLWSIGNLASGTTEALIIAVTVNSGLDGAIVRNQITSVTLDQLDNDTTGDILFAEFLTNDLPTATADTATTDEDISVNIDVTSNDTFGGDGPSATPITVTSGTTDQGGTVTVNDNLTPNNPTDDTIDYTPKADFNGTDTFEYNIKDSDGDLSSAVVTITVNSVNDTPTAVDDPSVVVQEDSIDVIISVFGNDDFGGDGSGTFVLATLPTNGTATIDDKGNADVTDDVILYTPNPNYHGVDTFTYTITDTDGDAATATVTVTVESVNDTPTAVDDTATTDEDTPLNIDVLANDNFGGDGPSATPIEVTSGSTDKGGSVVVNKNGTPDDPTDDTIGYTPKEDFNGTDTFDYEIHDFDGNVSTATVTVTVNPINDTPLAVDDTATVLEDSSNGMIPVTSNDDFGGDGPSAGTITLELATIVNGATITVNDNATPNNPTDDIIDYTPAANFNGTDSFDYTIADIDGETSTATVTVTVTGVNDLPMAAADTATTDEDISVNIDVTSNDTFGGDGPSATPITVTSGTTDQGGTVTVNDNLTPNNPTDDTIDYTPKADFNGTDTFEYNIKDSDGDLSSAVVTITVNSVNDTPTAVDDPSVVVQEDSIDVIISVFGNDDFGGDGSGTFVLATLPTNGTATIDDKGNADVTDDVILYTPNPNYHGVDTFTYTITDTDGDAATATVTVTVESVNDTPTAVDDTATTDEDTPLNIDVLANDNFGGDGPSATPIEVTSGSTDKGGSVVVNKNGTPDDPTDDTIGYTPKEDFNGTDTFDYEIHDFDGNVSTATVTVTVNPINDTPLAVDDTATVLEDSSNGMIPVTSNDDFGGDGPSAGTITLELATIVNGATITVNDNATPNNPTDDIIDYTPAANFNGTDSFDYTIADIDGETSTATVTVTVTGVNDLPMAAADTATTDEDISVNIDVTSNDTFGGDGPSATPITVTSGTTDQGGTVTVNDNLTPNNPTDDTIDYTPKADFNGTDTFEYNIKDSDGDLSSAVVTITVNSVNDTPTAVDDPSVVVQEDSIDVIISVFGNDDFGGDGSGTFVLATLPTNGTATIDDKGNADVTDDVILYTPNPNYHGVDTFTYTITDTDGDAATATVTVTVESVNDTPTAVDDTATTDEDTPLNIDVLANDNFGGDGPSATPIEVTSGSTDKGGSVVVNKNGTPDDPTDDTIGYTPKEDFNGTDIFSYGIKDSDGSISIAIVIVTVNPINDVPVAADDAASTSENSTGTVIAVLSNDTFGGEGPNSGSILLSGTAPTNGVATVDDKGTPNDPTDDTIFYTPNAAFDGVDTFNYTITDSDGDTSEALVTVTVSAVDVNPIASDDQVQIKEDSGLNNIDVLANDNFGGNGPGTSPITISASSTVNGATIVVNDGSTPTDPTDDSIDYTPFLDFNGEDTFTYTITDSDGDPSTATVYVTVLDVNDVPTAVDDSFTVNEDSGANSIPVVVGNGSGVNADDFGGDGPSSGSIILTSGGTTVSVSNPNLFNATVGVDDNGTPNDPTDDFIIYTPSPDFNGTDTFTYAIEDSNGDFSEATVTVTVNPVNDVPMATLDYRLLTEDDLITNIDVLSNDSFGGDGPSISKAIVVVSSPTANGGIAVVDDNGTPTDPTDDSIDYTPAANYNGIDSFEYTITDANDDPSTATVIIEIVPVNDLPVAVADIATVAEDSQDNNIIVLTNDDFGGDGPSTGTITLSSGPAPADPTVNGGIVTVNDGGTPDDPADDTITYTPGENFNGEDTFYYTITDSDGDTSEALVTVTVTSVDDFPVAVADAIIINEDDPTTNILVTANDDFGGDGPSTTPITVSVSPTANGTTVIVNDGGTPMDPTDDSIDFTPAPNYNGEDTFTYTITDSDGDESTATVTVTILPVNDLPSAVDDVATVAEDSIDNIILVVANDNFGGDGPSSGSIILTSGVTSVSIIDANSFNGTVVVDDNGTPNNPTDDFILYTPSPDFNGTDTFTYKIVDSNNDSSEATVTVTVTPVNDLPNAKADFLSTFEDAPTSNIPVTLNDDFGGDGPSMTPITISTGTSVNGGTIAVNDNLTPDDPTDDSIDYTPAANYNGIDSFEYTITDANDDPSTATVIIEIVPVNDLPVAVADVATVAEDSQDNNIIVLTNDDFGGDGPSTGTITLSSGPAPADPTVNGGIVTVNDGGTPDDPADDTITYTPGENFNGEDTFYYTITDSDGDTSEALVTVTVTSVDDFPVAVADAIIINEDDPTTNILVTANDDFGGDGPSTTPITVSVSPTANGTTVIVNDGGTPMDPTDDSIDFTPAPNYNGEDTFTYTITDSDGDESTATVTVTILPVNDLPSAVDDVATVAEDSIDNIILVVANDNFGGDGPSSGSIILTSGVTSVSIIDANSFNGTVVVGDNGTPNNPTDDFILYTPSPDFNGTDTFTYKIVDSNNDSSEATVTVTVTPVNDLPNAKADFLSTFEDAPTSNIPVTLNDDFGGDGPSMTPITISTGTSVNGGTIAVNDNLTLDDPTDDSIDYTPAANYNGIDSFEYTITDANDDPSTATVIIEIVPVNDLPVAVADIATVAEDSQDNNIIVLTNDDFGGDGPSTGTITLSSGPAPADPTVNGGIVTVNDGGTPDDPADDTITYTPGENFNGEDTFYYTITDSDGDTSEALVTVTVTPVTDVADDVASTNEDNAVVIDIFANDDDINPNATITIYSVMNGTVTIDDNGTVDTILDDIITYTPFEDYNGVGTFMYEICDATNCYSAEVTVSITPKLDVENDFYLVRNNRQTLLDVYGNDNDIPDSGMITIVDPLNGMLAIDDNGTPNNPSDDIFVYTPDLDYVGADSFMYTICDTDNPSYCESGTVSLNVVYIGAIDDEVETNEDFEVQIDFLENDLDVPSDGEITMATPLNGTVVIDTNGTPSNISDDTFIYTSNLDFNGIDTFTYMVCDAEGHCTSAMVTVTVIPVVDAIDDTVEAHENQAEEIAIYANDNDIPNVGTLTATTPANGTVFIDSNGTPDNPSDDIVTYTPRRRFFGTDTFEYTICDNQDPMNCKTAVVTVTVIPAIVVKDDAVETIENEVLVIDMFSNDLYIPTLGTLTITNTENGTVVIDTNNTPNDPSDDTVVYTPNEDFYGTDRFDYTICDDEDPANCRTAEVVITVIEYLPEVFILPNEPESTHKGFGFSPNGDGKNDVFRVHSDDGKYFIEKLYPNFKIEIFNRWGKRLYSYTHNGDPNSPQPGWDGKSSVNKEFTINAGDGVPAGTYFYTIDFNDRIRKPYSGWIYLSN